MKTIPPALIPKKNALYDTDAWYYLFQITVDSGNYIYVTNHSETVTYDGLDYEPAPIVIGDMNEDGKGNLESISLSVSNVNRTAIAYVEQYDLQGNDVVIKLMNHSDNTVVIEMGTYQIMEITADQRAVNFILGHYNFFKLTFPSNRYNKRRCRWQFKSTQCGYVGIHSECNFTLDGNSADDPGCTYHVNTERFGGFPGIPAGRFVVR